MSALCGIPRTAALCDLAMSLYYARATVFDLDVCHWDALSFADRHAYVTMAEAALDAVKPAAPLFELAVSLSRAEGARLLAFRGQDTSDGRD